MGGTQQQPSDPAATADKVLKDAMATVGKVMNNSDKAAVSEANTKVKAASAEDNHAALSKRRGSLEEMRPGKSGL